MQFVNNFVRLFHAGYPPFMEHPLIHNQDVIDSEVSQEYMRSFVNEISQVDTEKLITKMMEAEKQQITSTNNKINKESDKMYECDPESSIFGRTSVFRKLVQGKARFSPLAPYGDAIELCAYRLSNNALKKPRSNSKNSNGIDLKIKHSSLGHDIQLKSKKRRPVSL